MKFIHSLIIFTFTFSLIGYILIFAAEYSNTGSDHISIQKSQIERFTVDEGLSQNSVGSIIQDHQGYIWIATKDGLNRFDGYNFKRYYHSPDDEFSLSSSSVSVLHEDRFGILWIGTIGGIDAYDEIHDRFLRKFMTSACAICEDSSGLWFGSAEGIYKLDLADNKLDDRQNYTNDLTRIADYNVTALCRDRIGNLWVGTFTNGLYKLPADKNDFVHFKSDAQNPNAQSRNQITTICEGTSGNIWVGTFGGGLNRFDPGKQKFYHYQTEANNPNSLGNDFVNDIFQDQSGELWIGTEGGVYRYRDADKSFIYLPKLSGNPEKSGNNKVYVILQDRMGGYWFGLRGGGIIKYYPKAAMFEHVLPDSANKSVNANMVWSIYRDHSGDLWMGTNYGLVRRSKIEPNQYDYERYTVNNIGANDLQIRAICEDRMGNLWVGALHGGLARFDKKKQIFDYFQNDPEEIIYDICIDDIGIFWIGTNQHGLERFDPATHELRRYAFANNENEVGDGWVIDVLDDGKGNLWLGTWKDGLVRFDKTTEKFTFYRHDSQNLKSINHDIVFSIYRDSQGTFWVGTYGDGLNRFDPKTGEFSAYTMKDGLPNDVIYGILEDDYDCLWLSTNKGISRFDPKTETFRNYDVGDGLQSNEFNLGAFFKDKQGRLYFGGPNGLNSFSPDHIINTDPPLVILTAFRKDGQKVAFEQPLSQIKEIHLSHNDNRIAFDFAALHYKDPAKNQFAYQLENFDPDWNYSGSSRQAVYTNLNPGKYIFKVKAANCDGIWTPNATSIALIIHPAFWKTWWFYLLAGFTLFMLTLSIYRYHLHQAFKIEHAQMEERERILRKVTADFHDELGHRITKISLISKMMRKELADSPSNIKRNLDQVIENSDNLFKEMKEFIWELDPEKDKLYDLAAYLKNFSDQLFEQTDIAFQLKYDENGIENIRLPLTWRQQILCIFKEGMNNILKHAKFCNNAYLIFQQKDGTLEIMLKDDGYGFNQNDVTSGMGLKNMKTRAKEIGGNLDIESANGQGTRITLWTKLP